VQIVTDPAAVLYQVAYYFPYYVMLVLVPMVIRLVIERAIGIRPEVFETRISPLLPVNLSYEAAFQTFVYAVLYFPFFEELVFRGVPYLLFGPIGAIIGSAIWVVMHPAWQLQYLRGFPLRKKILFTATTTFYYATNAVFYTMMWLGGAGVAAIIYHVAHNGWLTLADMLKEVEMPAPWKRYRFVRRHPIGMEKPETPKILRLFKRSKKPEPAVEEEVPLSQMKFVVRKSTRSLREELESEESEEIKKFMFVTRKSY